MILKKRGGNEKGGNDTEMVLWYVTPMHMTTPTLEVLGGAAAQVFSYRSVDTAISK